MPQISLECTNNILEKHTFHEVFAQIHQILVEKLPTELSNCKARAFIHDTYVVGNGDKNNAFVHLSISVLKGRSTASLDQIASILMNILKEFFHLSLSQLNLQITIAMQNLPDVYHKLS